jgi:phage replication O-like protein O
MANPQKEHGYTAIANELFDALCSIRVNGEARQVLDVIFRKTYGFNKKEDRIALSQFVENTGMSKPKVCRSINKLKDMNLIVVTKKENDDNIFRVNKDYVTWRALPKKETIKSFPKKEIIVPQKGKASFPKKGHTKDNTTKDNTKEREMQLPPATTPSDEARDFFSKGDSYKKTFDWLKTKTTDEKLITLELNKFILYWTEKNSTGRKERWQMEKTFEVRRRLATWLTRVKQFTNTSLKKFEDTQTVDNFSKKI